VARSEREATEIRLTAAAILFVRIQQIQNPLRDFNEIYTGEFY
jgi:hypothetical protein